MLIVFLVFSDMEKKKLCLLFYQNIRTVFSAYYHWSLVTTKEGWFVQLVVKIVDRPSDIFFLKIF